MVVEPQDPQAHYVDLGPSLYVCHLVQRPQGYVVGILKANSVPYQLTWGPRLGVGGVVVVDQILDSGCLETRAPPTSQPAKRLLRLPLGKNDRVETLNGGRCKIRRRTRPPRLVHSHSHRMMMMMIRVATTLEVWQRSLHSLDLG